MKEIWWAKKNPDGTYTVDAGKLLFSLILDELAIAGAIRKVDEEGKVISRGNLREVWRAKIQNLRKIPKMTVVRASYYLFYKPTHNEYPWRQGWKAAWDHANYLFTTDLNSA